MPEVPSDEHIEDRARELEHGGEGAEELEDDPDRAQRAATRILEESERRTFERATVDPEADTVVRRSSDESASRPE